MRVKNLARRETWERRSRGLIFARSYSRDRKDAQFFAVLQDCAERIKFGNVVPIHLVLYQLEPGSHSRGLTTGLAIGLYVAVAPSSAHICIHNSDPGMLIITCHLNRAMLRGATTAILAGRLHSVRPRPVKYPSSRLLRRNRVRLSIRNPPKLSHYCRKQNSPPGSMTDSRLSHLRFVRLSGLAARI